jgi:hypothetical protein
MTHTKDKALQMCLEYIETDAHERKYVRHAIKQALAAPVQEGKWIGTVIDSGKGYKTIGFSPDSLADIPIGTKLYTTPPAAQPAVPLTYEQIESLLPDDDTPMSLGEAFVKFARMVEAHHNITAAPEKGQA